MEAYQHVFDRDEKRRLAQVMTDIMHQRPRFDFSSHYFVRSYRLECIILRHKSQLVKTVLDTQVSAFEPVLLYMKIRCMLFTHIPRSIPVCPCIL